MKGCGCGYRRGVLENVARECYDRIEAKLTVVRETIGLGIGHGFGKGFDHEHMERSSRG